MGRFRRAGLGGVAAGVDFAEVLDAHFGVNGGGLSQRRPVLYQNRLELDLSDGNTDLFNVGVHPKEAVVEQIWVVTNKIGSTTTKIWSISTKFGWALPKMCRSRPVFGQRRPFLYRR